MDRLPLGCTSIDEMLDGGIESSSMTLLYGEAGSGKTTVCLILAKEIIKQGKKVVYIDSEGISIDRLMQIAGEDFDLVMQNLLVFDVVNFDSQERSIDKAVKMVQSDIGVGMIIVDSITSLYRPTGKEDERSERKSLVGQSQKLSSIAREKKIPVLVTSQVYTDVETGTFESLGGNALMHNSKSIIRFDRAGLGMRRAVLIKHRSIPEGITAQFRLTCLLYTSPSPRD